MSARRPTATSKFGVSRRESHDATAFYSGFSPPELTLDDNVALPRVVENPFICGDARSMSEIVDDSVALIVTSPPYFAGKQYELELGANGIPGSYLEYLELLREVFSECKRVLEPGGRIAVNVANLGRKPFRSLAGDVSTILQDDLHLLLRGEVVWKKGDGASGSCAWGSFRSPRNPVLRDLTERIVIASKGRFDRALSPNERAARKLPSKSSITSDEFMAATLDLWEIAPESARRVDHPAPFPVELPERLIHLYTFVDDLVLDPFMGSGSTLVAAARTNRRYIGFDLDPDFVSVARRRVDEELAARSASKPELSDVAATDRSARLAGPITGASSFRDLVQAIIGDSGFEVAPHDVRKDGPFVDVVATDQLGESWNFVTSGAITNVRNGLARRDLLWSAIGRALLIAQKADRPVVLLSSHLPVRPSEGDSALRAAGPNVIFDVINVQSAGDIERLHEYARRGREQGPRVGFWKQRELPEHSD